MMTIDRTYQADYRDRGSKFLAYLFPCENEETFEERLQELRSEFHDASHHCYGYRINPNSIREFSSDDGEPGGTAGLPILNQLKSFEAVNAGLIVVRYFGGTKLGKSGLIEAYGSAAQECLEKADLQRILPVQLFEIHYPYSQENVINKLFLNYELVELHAHYLAEVRKRIACPVNKSSALKQELEGLAYLDIRFNEKEVSFIPLP